MNDAVCLIESANLFHLFFFIAVLFIVFSLQFELILILYLIEFSTENWSGNYRVNPIEINKNRFKKMCFEF